MASFVFGMMVGASLAFIAIGIVGGGDGDED